MFNRKDRPQTFFIFVGIKFFFFLFYLLISRRKINDIDRRTSNLRSFSINLTFFASEGRRRSPEGRKAKKLTINHACRSLSVNNTQLFDTFNVICDENEQEKKLIYD